MRQVKSKARKGFSLIELVIVVVIIGIIAAIAIPKMSRGAAGASDTAMAADVYLFHQAIDMYCSEHNGVPPDSADTISDQLTLFTDAAGNTSGARTGAFVFGPYLKAIPCIPVGPFKGKNTIADGTSLNPGSGSAWIYHGDVTGRTYVLIPNTTAQDLNGNAYFSY